jgi:hypothetical protein
MAVIIFVAAFAGCTMRQHGFDGRSVLADGTLLHFGEVPRDLAQ